MATIRTETQPKSAKKTSRFPRLLESIFSSTTGQQTTGRRQNKGQPHVDQDKATQSDLLSSRQQSSASANSKRSKPKAKPRNTAKRDIPSQAEKKVYRRTQRNEPWSQASIILYDRQLRQIESLIKEVEKTAGRNIPRSEMVRVLLDLNFEPHPNQPEIKNLTGLKRAILRTFKA